MQRTENPCLAAVAALGLPELTRSTQRRPVFAARFGADAGVGRLLVVAGVHGDEPATVEATAELCRALAAAPPAGTVWVVPVLNPDGIAAGQKNSAHDVDLNRNFPARTFTPAHRPGYFPGERPLCEPETQALAALIDRERITGVIAVHAPFACINFDGPARAWADAVSAACGWPTRADMGYPTPGSLGSWLGVDRGLAVLTIELPPGPYAAFRGPAQAALLAAVNPGGIG